MSFIDSFDHLVFRNFFCAGFDHDYFLSCGSYCKLKVRYIFLCHGRVDDIFTIDQTNLCGSTWTIKRNIGNAGCNRGTKHSRNLRITFRINRHNHVYQCYIISVILWKQRTHRSVNNTGCKNSMFACFTFSLIKTSRDLSYCIHFLFVFNTQREEINSLSWLFGCCCCG